MRRPPVPHNPYRMRGLLSRQPTKQVSELLQAGGVRARHGIAYLLLLLFCFVATSYLIRMADFAMGGAAALLLFGVVVQRQPFTLGGKPGYWLLAYAGFVCLSVFTSVWLGPSIDGTKELGKFMVVFIVTLNALTTRKRIWWLLLFLTLLIAVFPGLGAVKYYFLGATKAAGRANWKGLFGNPNMVALTMLMHVPFAVAFLLQRRSVLWRTGWAGVVVLLLAVTLLTKSRAGYLALLVLAGGAIWVSQRRLRVTIVVVIAAVALAVLAPGDFRQRVSTVFAPGEQRDYSAESRIIIWRTAVEIALRRPLTGIGVGTYERANAELAPAELGDAGGLRWRDTHSTYLNIWAEIGTPGLIAFVGAFVLLLWRIRRVISSADPRDPLVPLMRAGIISLLVFLTMSLFNTFHTTWYLYAEFGALLAAISVLEPVREPKSRTQIRAAADFALRRHAARSDRFTR